MWSAMHHFKGSKNDFAVARGWWIALRIHAPYSVVD